MNKNQLVEIRNLVKSYNMGAVSNQVLKGVTLTIQAGEIVAIMGQSGSGKSTLLNLIGALDSPDKGLISIGNDKVSSMNREDRTTFRRKNIGFVFQDFNLVETLNVYENICMPLELNKMIIDDLSIDEMLKALNIEDKKFAYPSQLSGGEQQRVAIIRALISNPKLVLADEPTGSLDSINSHEVISLLRDLCHGKKQTTLIVTHDKEIAMLCDRIIKIENGLVIGGGSSGKTIIETI